MLTQKLRVVSLTNCVESCKDFDVSIMGCDDVFENNSVMHI